MKAKQYTWILSPFLILFLFQGCKKEVQVAAPVTQLATPTVFNSDATSTSAMLNIYARNIAFASNLHVSTGLSADELTNYSADQTLKDLYANALNGLTDANFNGPSFLSGYTNVYYINAILENLPTSTGVNAKVKKQLTGEAYFMRAYFYFYLVNLYGDVPLVTSTDYKVNSTIARSPSPQVYQQIVSDLKQAQGLLNSNFVDATDTITTVDRIRPTASAATALLARTLLYMGNDNYSEAEKQATAVISNPLFSLPTDLTKVFTKNSTEAIWQMMPNTNLYTNDGQSFIITSAPGPSSLTTVAMSPQLYSAFEAGDLRKQFWVGSYTSGGNTWYFPFKYRDNNSSSSLKEYTMMLRLAEQYLIRAEARLQQGNVSGAIVDLNTIRSRSGLAAYSGQTDKASLLAAIAHERQVELFTEGDRWLDIKRTKTVDAIMGTPGNVCAAKGGQWDTRQQLYPLYPNDLLKNPNLVQNPGY